MYLAAKFELISIVRNSLTMREECRHQQFLLNSGCKSHRALLIWPILAEGAASSAAWCWVSVLLVQVCKEVHDPGETDRWSISCTSIFMHFPRLPEQLSREGALLSLPLHAVNPGKEMACQKTRHFFFKPGQFTLRSVFWSLTAWSEKHLCWHRGREHKPPSGEHGGTGNPFWLQNTLLPA